MSNTARNEPGRLDDWLLAAIQNLIRVGVVSDPQPGRQTARVTFDDRDNLVSHDMQILVKETAGTRDQWTPQIGQQVVCLFLPTGVETGFIIGSVYDDSQDPPFEGADERGSVKSDGTIISYDTAAHLLRVINGPARATIDRESINARIGNANIIAQDGEVSMSVGGAEMTLTAAGLDFKGTRLTHNGVNVGATHAHNGVSSGKDVSGTPV